MGGKKIIIFDKLGILPTYMALCNDKKSCSYPSK